MKASVKYSNGWLLIVPKEGNCSMLFLEWMCNFQAGKNPIHKVNQPMEGEYFCIRLNITKKQMEDCAEYINLNS